MIGKDTTTISEQIPSDDLEVNDDLEETSGEHTAIEAQAATAPNPPLVPEYLNLAITINCESANEFWTQFEMFERHFQLKINNAVRKDLQTRVEKVPEEFLKREKFSISFIIPKNSMFVFPFTEPLNFLQVIYGISSTVASPMGTAQLIDVPPGLTYAEAADEFFQRFIPTIVTIVDETNPNIEWAFMHNGIWRICFEIDDHTGFRNEHSRGQAWIWDELRVSEVMKLQDQSMKYDFWFNGVLYKAKDIADVPKIIAPGSLQNKSHFTKFGPLFRKFVKEEISKHRVKIWRCVQSMGFNAEGWLMPDECRIQVNPGIQEKMRDALDRIMGIEVDDVQAQNYFLEQYNVTHIAYRDVLFAWACIQWGVYALVEYTRLRPWVGLWAHTPQTGKSTFALSITSQWWDHLGTDDDGKHLEMLVSSVTESQAKEYLASVPLAILFDDCGGLDLKIKDLIKAIATGVSSWNIKNPDSTLRISKSYKAMPIMTFNDVPGFLLDTAILERGVIFPLKTKFPVSDAKRYKETMDRQPKGYLGKYIVEKTRHLNISKLKDLYDAQPDWPDAPDDRANTIWKIFELGAEFAKSFFAVDLNIVELKDLILTTRMVGFEDLFDTIKEQIDAGNIDTHMVEPVGKDNTNTPYFKASRPWIQAPIYPHYLGKVMGYLYDNSNKEDLSRYLGKKEMNLTLPKLHEILRNRWTTEYPQAGIKHDCIVKKRLWISHASIYWEPPKTPSYWPAVLDRINKIGSTGDFMIDDIWEGFAGADIKDKEMGNLLDKNEVAQILEACVRSEFLLLNAEKYHLRKPIPTTLKKTEEKDPKS